MKKHLFYLLLLVFYSKFFDNVVFSVLLTLVMYCYYLFNYHFHYLTKQGINMYRKKSFAFLFMFFVVLYFELI